MGGLGKTRLSLQVAARADRRLSPTAPGSSTWRRSATRRWWSARPRRCSDVREEPGRPLMQTLCAHLQDAARAARHRQLRAPAQACADLAHAHPEGRTRRAHASPRSREALHVPGEQAYPILPLPVPDARRQPGDAGALDRGAPVRRTRAAAQAGASSSTRREAPAVAELVARLEGIPLALELAAARVRSLVVADINKRLKDRYKLLTGGSRVLQERQQTLRALVDWSYDLLNETEQSVLQRLARVRRRLRPGGGRGGVRRRAARSDWTCSDLLASLVEKSLVMLEERDEGTRYRMLETTPRLRAREAEQSGETAPRPSATASTYFAFAKEVARRPARPRAGALGRARRDRARQPARRDRAGAGRRRRPASSRSSSRWRCRTSGSCAAMPPKAARGACGAGAAGDPGVGPGAGMRACTSAPRWPRARATMPRRGRCSRPAWRCGGGWATRSTSRPRCRRWRMARLQGGDAAGARRERARGAADLPCQIGDRVGEAIGLLHLGQIAALPRRRWQAASRLGAGAGHRARDRAPGGRGRVRTGARRSGASKPATRRRSFVRFSRSLAICREAGDKRGTGHALAGRATWTSALAPRARRASAWTKRCGPSATSKCARNCWAAWKTMPVWPTTAT